eukprot:s3284_g7.t1
MILGFLAKRPCTCPARGEENPKHQAHSCHHDLSGWLAGFNRNCCFSRRTMVWSMMLSEESMEADRRCNGVSI